MPCSVCFLVPSFPALSSWASVLFLSSLLGFRLGLGSRPSGAILVLAFGCHSQFGVRVRGHDDLGGVFFRGSLSSAVRQRRLALEVRRSAVNVRLVVYVHVCARSSGRRSFVVRGPCVSPWPCIPSRGRGGSNPPPPFNEQSSNRCVSARVGRSSGSV